MLFCKRLTDKFFGAHVCDDDLWDEDWRQLEVDRHHYFDCLHALQAKQVYVAIERLTALPARCYAPGHGPMVRYSLSRFHQDYRLWCQQQAEQNLRVALLYASAYGNTATLAGAIAQGLIQSGVAVESINCELADPAEIARTVEACDGFIIGSPTLGGHAPVQIQSALGILLSAAAKSKLAAVFGSYGWSGEAIDLLEQKLRDARYRFGFEPIRVRFSPDRMTLQICEDAGAEFAQQLRRHKKRRRSQQAVTATQADRTEQAVGRVVGSLCVLTTSSGGHHSGVLTAWASQATFNPPGVMVALSATQQVEGLLQPGASFVLNILKEGRSVRRHFAFDAPGDPFAQLSTRPASNGCLVLEEALAYVECTVQQWMPCGDDLQSGQAETAAGERTQLICAVIERGEVLQADGVTAIRQRTSGGQH
jgi:flavin reductase (DIM6/NTAB) family NADH-FMN oxidoreductase RutF/flavodoxin